MPQEFHTDGSPSRVLAIEGDDARIVHATIGGYAPQQIPDLLAAKDKRIADLERFAEWAKQHATAQAKACRQAGIDDIPWCKVVDQAEAALTKSTGG